MCTCLYSVKYAIRLHRTYMFIWIACHEPSMMLHNLYVYCAHALKFIPLYCYDRWTVNTHDWNERKEKREKKKKKWKTQNEIALIGFASLNKRDLFKPSWQYKSQKMLCGRWTENLRAIEPIQISNYMNMKIEMDLSIMWYCTVC